MRRRFDFFTVKITRPHVVTFAMVTLAVLATCILYWRYSTKPWTRDGQVRANVVGIAPRVSGPIIQIPIKDNQAVKKGDLLFAIDPTTFQAAVENAAAKLKQSQAAETQLSRSSPGRRTFTKPRPMTFAMCKTRKTTTRRPSPIRRPRRQLW